MEEVGTMSEENKPKGVTSSGKVYRASLILWTIAALTSISTGNPYPVSAASVALAACWHRRHYQRRYTRKYGRVDDDNSN